ncbi:hypothetical protein ABGB16_08530 [Micromonospora sp. B11E3]|uniref:hypothetical protein n=1 Tax=Micromonospora sp. B11E3 TaxID=3153562 RepID=UPI00325D374F
MTPERQEAPFSVILASYCIEFHTRNTCFKCTDDGCPRLAGAQLRIDTYRLAKLALRRSRRLI